MTTKADRMQDWDDGEDDVELTPAERQRLKQELIDSIERARNDPRPDISVEEMREFIENLKYEARNR